MTLLIGCPSVSDAACLYLSRYVCRHEFALLSINFQFYLSPTVFLHLERTLELLVWPISPFLENVARGNAQSCEEHAPEDGSGDSGGGPCQGQGPATP